MAVKTLADNDQAREKKGNVMSCFSCAGSSVRIGSRV